MNHTSNSRTIVKVNRKKVCLLSLEKVGESRTRHSIRQRRRRGAHHLSPVLYTKCDIRISQQSRSSANSRLSPKDRYNSMQQISRGGVIWLTNQRDSRSLIDCKLPVCWSREGWNPDDSSFHVWGEIQIHQSLCGLQSEQTRLLRVPPCSDLE